MTAAWQRCLGRLARRCVALCLSALCLSALCVTAAHADKPVLQPSDALVCLTPDAATRGLQGRIVARFSFDAPDKPPTIELFHRPAVEALRPAVEDWLSRLRMPCHEGRAVRAQQTFVFTIESSGYGFKAIGLRQFLSAVRSVHLQRLQWDTREMGCPFDLRLQYLQPLLRNEVTERGPPDARREPLLDWFRDSQLELPRTALDSIFGDTADIHVPCTIIDLNPQEKTS